MSRASGKGEVIRIAASPEDVRELVAELRDAVLASNHTKRAREQQKKLFAALHALQLVSKNGTKRSLNSLLSTMRRSATAEMLEVLDQRNFWTMPPFATLGRIPIARSADDAAALDATRVADLFPPFGGVVEREERIPVFGRNRHSHTFYMYWSNSWWTTLFYSKYKASTRATAEGYDAAELTGGMYAQAKFACDTLVVPPPDDPGSSIVAFLKAASCLYASKTPEIPWPAEQISTVVCSCFIDGADGSCDFHDAEECGSKDIANSAGPATATHGQWSGPVCAGVRSRHEIQFAPGVSRSHEDC